MEGNADLVPVLFGPDWVMRVYHNISPNDVTSKELIEKLTDFYPHLDFCYVKDIQGFGNLSGMVKYNNLFYVKKDRLFMKDEITK